MTPQEELELLLGPNLWPGFSFAEVTWALAEAGNVALEAAAILCSLRGRQQLAEGVTKKITVDGASIEMSSADWFAAAVAFRAQASGQDSDYYFEVV